MSLAALLALGILLLPPGTGQADDDGTTLDPSDIVDALLGGLMGLGEMSGPELQKEVAEVGGVPFRADVPLDFMTREQLKAYLGELVDSEYPPERALQDQRTLIGLGLLVPGRTCAGSAPASWRRTSPVSTTCAPGTSGSTR